MTKVSKSDYYLKKFLKRANLTRPHCNSNLRFSLRYGFQTHDPRKAQRLILIIKNLKFKKTWQV
jgi:hypothetical protein